MSASVLAAAAGLCAAAAFHELATALDEPAVRAASRSGASRARPGKVPAGLPVVAAAGIGGALLLGGAGLILGVAVGVGGAHALRRRERRGLGRARAAGTGPLARSLADGLRAGQSIRGALGAAAADRSVPAAVRAAAGRACTELARGEPLPAAMRSLGDGGVGGGQLALLAALVVLHAEQGGALVQQLYLLADDAELAARLDEERAGATAQARATVRTVAALPLVALGGAQLMGGDLLGAVASKPAALALLVTGLLLELAAVLIAQRIVARVA